MKPADINAILWPHQAELRAAGVVRLSVFGSVARGDARPDSDIDLAAVFDKARLSLLDLVALQNRLSSLLGAPVDLSDEEMLKPVVAARFRNEAQTVF